MTEVVLIDEKTVVIIIIIDWKGRKMGVVIHETTVVHDMIDEDVIEEDDDAKVVHLLADRVPDQSHPIIAVIVVEIIIFVVDDVLDR